MNCKKLATKILLEDDIKPSKHWFLDTAKEFGFSFELPTNIPEERFNAASLNLLHAFYEEHEEVIKECPSSVLIGADETMMSSLIKEKVITMAGISCLCKNIDIPHITCMCAHTASGTALPLFIILPNSIQSLPVELNEFNDNGQAWFASSKSGWMTRDLFLVWVIHVIHWFSLYIKKLDKSLRNKKALMVMDGHESRECPLALYLLKCNSINVLILPAHTTHITQMFDVFLAHSLKRLAAKIMKKLMKENIANKDMTRISIIRKSAIMAVISAWVSICNPESCQKQLELLVFRHIIKIKLIIQNS